MAEHKVWIGNFGPFIYNDTEDLPGEPPGTKPFAIRTDGRIRAASAVDPGDVPTFDQVEASDPTILREAGVVNDLVTGGTSAPLSAEQGKSLKQLIDAVDTSSYVQKAGDTMTGLLRNASGINFNASGGNTLSSYEVGTFTPILTAFTTDFTSVTYTIQDGRYVLIGNRCFFDARLTISAVDKTGAAGSVSVQGFPFVTLNSTNYRAVAEINLRGGFVNRPDGATAFSNFNGFTLYRNDSSLQPADVSTGANAFVISGSYIIQP